MNEKIIKAAYDAQIDYFDLTEDVESRHYLENLLNIEKTKSKFFMHCGLAPGVVSIIAGNLSRKFREVKSIKIRVGALPQDSTNEFGYNVNWSIDGLINECQKPCECIIDGKLYNNIPSLTGKETVFIGGKQFEAFYTSGGIGTLTETYNKATSINYKTLRYPGHLEKFKLYYDSKMLEALKLRLQDECPYNSNDVVYYLVSVVGIDNKGLKSEKIYSNVVYPKYGYTAIQTTTAGSLCGVFNMYSSGEFDNKTGLIKQEEIDFDKFLSQVLIENLGILN